MSNWEKVRDDFPILKQRVNGERLAYLDNAATAQRPTPVLNDLLHFYQHDNANVHRGVHTLAMRATEQYEAARQTVQHFIHAQSPKEIIFTKGTTDGLNLVASTYGREHIHAEDEIVISIAEHHSNLVPWQQLAIEKHAVLKYIGLTADGELDLDDAQQKITDKTKIVAVTHASNVLGTATPLKEITRIAHQHGAVVVGDGAQAVPHFAVDVTDLGVDFYAFSGQKMMSSMGVGVLYGRQELLSQMPPYQFGGEMISTVKRQSTIFAEPPYKFEAGTQNVAGAISLASAIKYLNQLGMDKVEQHEQQLVVVALPRLLAEDHVTVYGPHDPAKHTGVISFNIEGLHPHDVATALDMEGIAVRAGHHCAEPLMGELDTTATVRASFYLYNDLDDVDQLIHGIQETKEFFHVGTV